MINQNEYKLTTRPVVSSYEYLNALLNRELITLKTDLKRYMRVWVSHLGEPFNKERLILHSDKDLSIMYVDKLNEIEDCKKALKSILSPTIH